ncbi:MAG: lysophospholipid acyltransferase family protein [Phycisphaerales bacterium]|nr:lysophospholipid acyltransferase family protein [Phycisphaerales bacterium]
MARNESYILNQSAYVGVRALGTLMQCFEVNDVMAAVGGIGDLWYRRDQRRRERSLAHIRASLPHLSAGESSELCRLSMRHLLQTFAVELLFTPRLVTPSTWPRYVRLGDVRRAMPILTADRPAIFLSGHCGNFELLGFTLATFGFPMTALARPLDLPRLSDWLFDIREKRGMTILTKFGATEQVAQLIEQGRRVAFIADQNAGDRGLFVPFFGRLASAYKSIGLLAMRYDVPIICGFARRDRPDVFRYTLDLADVIEPADWKCQSDPLYYITARYTRSIEEMVRQAPEQYFWVHRRWKSRPPHERAGRPVPDSLREKIAALPWITDSEVQQIIEQSERESALAR